MKEMNKRSFRCAIYTRVSTDQRLEQDFNSLNAQREASEAQLPTPVDLMAGLGARGALRPECRG